MFDIHAGDHRLRNREQRLAGLEVANRQRLVGHHDLVDWNRRLTQEQGVALRDNQGFGNPEVSRLLEVVRDHWNVPDDQILLQLR